MPDKPIALVVDDEPDALALLVRVLSKTFDVRTFQDPHAALAAAIAAVPAIIIADQSMPGLSGVQLCRELRKKDVRCAFLMVSAFAELAEVRDALAEGLMFQVLSKPVAPDDLLAYTQVAVASFQLSAGKKRLARASASPEHPAKSTVATYDLAVVFDDIRRDFTQAHRELTRLQQKLPPSFLVRTDLLFIRPATLMCRLGFNPRGMATSKVAGRLSVAQSRHFRVLDLMTISSADGEELYERRLESASWQKTPSANLRDDLAELRSILGVGAGGSERRRSGRSGLGIPVRFVGGPEPAVGLAKDISTAGLYIESDILPKPGDKIELTLYTITRGGLENLPAQAIHITTHAEAEESGRVAGFGAVFDLDDAQRRLLESFLVSAVRGWPWPERSGRRYERLPMRLPVTYVCDGVERREVTTNISRGGFFIAAADAVEEGREMAFTLLSDIDGEGVSFEGRVVHRLRTEDLAHAEVEAGIGIEFIDPPSEIDAKLEHLLQATSPSEARRVFLIDDDNFYRAVMRSLLQRNGYEVIEAPSAEQAYAKLLEELLLCDALLIDLYLPGMSSRSLIDWVRHADGYSDIAIAVVTSRDLTPEEEKKLLEMGVDCVIPKKTAETRALAAIDRIIRAHGERLVSPR